VAVRGLRTEPLTTVGSEGDPNDVREAAATLRRVASELRGAIGSASPTAWPHLDAALRYVHGALLALGDVGDVALRVTSYRS
jgi:hypothetical protein